MTKTRWVLAIFLIITLILSTSVGYAQPEKSAETANDNASLLNELQLPADTPVEQITDTTEYAEDEIIKTAFGSMTIHNPKNITPEIQQALDSSRAESALTQETEMAPETSPEPEPDANNEILPSISTELDGQAWMTCDIPDEIGVGEERYINVFILKPCFGTEDGQYGLTKKRFISIIRKCDCLAE